MSLCIQKYQHIVTFRVTDANQPQTVTMLPRVFHVHTVYLRLFLPLNLSSFLKRHQTFTQLNGERISQKGGGGMSSSTGKSKCLARGGDWAVETLLAGQSATRLASPI